MLTKIAIRPADIIVVSYTRDDEDNRVTHAKVFFTDDEFEALWDFVCLFYGDRCGMTIIKIVSLIQKR